MLLPDDFIGASCRFEWDDVDDFRSMSFRVGNHGLNVSVGRNLDDYPVGRVLIRLETVDEVKFHF